MEFAAPSRPTEPSSKRTERTDLRKRSPRHRPQRITSRKLSLGTSNASSTEKREQKPKLSPTTPPPSYSVTPPNQYATKEEEVDSDDSTENISCKPLPVFLRPLQGVDLSTGPIPSRPPPKYPDNSKSFNNNMNTSIVSNKKSPPCSPRRSPQLPPYSSDQLGPIRIRLDHREDVVTTIFDLNHSDTSSNDSLSPTSLRPIQSVHQSPSISPSVNSYSNGRNIESKTSFIHSSPITPPSSSSSSCNTNPSSSSSLSSKFGQLPKMPVEDLNSSIGTVYSNRNGRRRRGSNKSRVVLPTDPIKRTSPGWNDETVVDRLEESWPPRRISKGSPQVLEEVGGRLQQFDKKSPPVGFGDTSRKKKQAPPSGRGNTGSKKHNEISGASSLSSLQSIPDIHGGRNTKKLPKKILFSDYVEYTALDEI
jgi:hypothetical protein